MRWRGLLLVLLLLPLLALAQEAPPEEAAPAEKKPAQETPEPLLDAHGDPLPDGAIARIGTLRWRVGPNVMGIRFLPDGKTIATVQKSGHVRLWDGESGRLVREARGMEMRSGDSIHLFPDGAARAAAIDAAAGAVRVFDPIQGVSIRDLPFPGREVVEARLSGDGARVIVRHEGREDGGAGGDPVRQRVDIYQVETGVRLSGAPVVPTGTDLACRTFHTDDDGSRLAVASPDRDLRVIEVSSGLEVFRTPFGEGEPPMPRLSPDGQFLAVREMVEGRERTAVVDLSTDREVAALTGRGEMVETFSDDGSILATSSIDSTIRIRETRTGKLLREIAGVSWPGLTLRISPDNRTIAIGGRRGKLRLWEIPSGREISADDYFLEPLIDITYSPNGRYLCGKIYSGGVAVWDLEAERRLPIVSHGGVFESVFAISPDSRTFAAYLGDEGVRIWDLETERLRSEIPPARPGCLALSPDGTAIVMPTLLFASLGVFDTATGKPLPAVEGSRKTLIRDLAFSAVGDLLYGSADPVSGVWIVRSWEWPAGKERTTLRGKDDGDVVRIFDSLGGRSVVLVGHRGSEEAFLADMTTGKKLIALGEWNSSFAISHDGLYFARTIGDDAVGVWEVMTMDEVRLFRGPPVEERWGAFSPDGRHLASSGTDTTILIWDLSPPMGEDGGGAEAPDDREETWRALALGGKGAADAAYRALWRLIGAGDATVPFLLERLTRRREVDAESVRDLIDRLDDDSYERRSRADRELRWLGEAAVPLLDEALGGDLSPEAKERLRRIMSDATETFVHSRSPSDRLRQDRAIGILERIGTTAALDALETIADDSPSARSRGAARHAALRLRRRLTDGAPKGGR